METVPERLLRYRRMGVAPFLLDKIKEELKFHLFSRPSRIERVFQYWVPMPLYKRRSWYHVIYSLYPRASWRHKLKQRIESHEHAEAIKHQIEEVAKELLDKGRWSEAKSILKPLIE